VCLTEYPTFANKGTKIFLPDKHIALLPVRNMGEWNCKRLLWWHITLFLKFGGKDNLCPNTILLF
jgi:hypothetical protein